MITPTMNETARWENPFNRYGRGGAVAEGCGGRTLATPPVRHGAGSTVAEAANGETLDSQTFHPDLEGKPGLEGKLDDGRLNPATAIDPEAASDLALEADRVAALMAATSEYAEAPAPDDLLALTGDEFARFCFAPRQRLNEIHAARADRRALDVLSAGWRASRKAGAVRCYEGKLVFPIPALRADGVTPLEVSLKRQAATRTDLLPWFVSYVNDFVKPRRTAHDAPSKALERFAWLGSWDAFLQELADIALDERWDFGAEDGEEPRNAILHSYICTTFYRLSKEGKIAIASDGSLAAFNTGLVNDRYDDIFACFEPSTDAIPWEFAGFATAGARGLGKRLVSLFNPLPEPASYFARKEDMLFDLGKELITDFDHVILDNIERLPIGFLEEELGADPVASRILEEARRASDRDERSRLFAKLSGTVDGDARLFRRLRSGLEDAIETARRRVRWNFKTAIPSYYPRGDAMSLLLPLDLQQSGGADAALVVQLMPSGNYQGQTILTIRQAYTNARIICRPDSDWLTTANPQAGARR